MIRGRFFKGTLILSSTFPIARAWLFSRSPQTTHVGRLFESTRILTQKSTPSIRAASVISLLTGLSFHSPIIAFGLRIISGRWLILIVVSEAIPGRTDFLPPEKPANSCGSTLPTTMRKSASYTVLLTCTGVPREVFPKSTSLDGSKGS